MGRVKRVIAGLAGAVFCISLLSLAVAGSSWADNGQINKRFPGEISFQRLEGRWIRPDGGYVLKVRDTKKNGSITAAYFNPKPIKVFRAEASRKDETIQLFVELRDINYPGSTYTLLYDPISDRLKGTYFQAVERRSFDIEFVRAK
jgi:hypothetical protein